MSYGGLLLVLGGAECDGTIIPNGETAGGEDAELTDWPKVAFTAGANDLALTAAADTFVRSGMYATQSFGANSIVQADADAAGSIKQAYVRFAVGDVGSITRARLLLFAVNATLDAVEVKGVSNKTWSESITWNDKPAVDGALIATITNAPVGKWIDLDITSAVTPSSVLSLALVAKATDGLTFSSREAAANQPRLVITGSAVVTSCTDGTASGACSAQKPMRCVAGDLMSDCTGCGCPSGQTCQANGTCAVVTANCADGTAANACSTTKPMRCVSGALTPACSTCGCPSGQTCQASGACGTGTTTCADGTAANTCSVTKPMRCVSGALTPVCGTCGCPSGQTCQTSGTCIAPPTTCADGTAFNACSATKPMRCVSGTLTPSCSSCGCPSGQTCQASGSCAAVDPCGNGACVPPETSSTCPADCPVTLPGVYTANYMATSPTIDGQLGEYAALASIYAAAGTATLRAGWNASALYLAYDVQDNMLIPGAATEADMWNGDIVEVMLDTLHNHGSTAGADDFHVLVDVARHMADSRGWSDWTFSSGATAAVDLRGGTVGGAATGGGYRVELRVPWASMGLSPKGGEHYGFDVAANDRDSTSSTVVPHDWMGLSSFNNPSGWGELVLAGSAPVTPCSDGTASGACSATKPMRCVGGTLSADCAGCGCPSGQTCQASGSCVVTPVEPCGNGVCVPPGETCANCRTDCGDCPSTGTFTFGLWGDTKSGTSTLASISKELAAKAPVFTLYAGDLQEAGFASSSIGTWANAMNGGVNNGMLNKTFVIRGNHDQANTSSWQSYFNFAGAAAAVRATNFREMDSELTYSFDYGNSHFVSVDVTGDVNEMTTAQITWVDSDLTQAEARGLTHAFFLWHGPLYPVGGHCCTQSKPEFVAMANKHPIVSATIGGHEHSLSYVNINTSRYANVTNVFEQIGAGSAGAGTNSCTSGRSDFCRAAAGYGTIEVSGNTFTVRLFQVGNSTPIWSKAFTK